MCDTCVDARLGLGHTLEHQTLVAHDDASLQVSHQGAAVPPPRDLVGRRVSPHATLEVHIFALLDIRPIE